METTAITGIGVISSLGHDKRRWFENLCQGRRLLRPFTDYVAPTGPPRPAFCVDDFDPCALLQTKGLQYFGRTHLLAAAAAHLAIADCGLSANAMDPACLGVVMAMTFGTLQNISGFYEQALAEGPAAVSPISFANTVANSPASRTAILLNAKGLNATLAHGENAGLEAIAVSAEQLARGPEKLILAGAGYGLCRDMMRAYDARGLLAFAENFQTQAASIPLDSGARGMVLGEAAAVLALETPADAAARGARAYGYVAGHAQGFTPYWSSDPEGAVERIAAIMRRALEKSGLSPEQIDWVAASAGGHPELDALEARAMAKVFGKTGSVRVAALKSMIGECFDAAGPLGVAAALLSFERGVIPPTAGLTRPCAELPQGCVRDRADTRPVRHVLVNALALSGGCSALVVSSRKQAC